MKIKKGQKQRSINKKKEKKKKKQKVSQSRPASYISKASNAFCFPLAVV
jgi:hypothetical protein